MAAVARQLVYHLARTARLWVYVILLAQCVDVANVSPNYNLSPAVKIYRRHRRLRSTRPAKETVECVFISDSLITVISAVISIDSRRVFELS